MGTVDRPADDRESVEAPLPDESGGYLWPARWWRAGCERLAALEERRGVFVAALVAAVLAEGMSFLFASSWYVQHADRFTGLSVAPFAVGDVPIQYAEHRLRLLGPVIAWMLGLGGSLWGTLVPVVANIPLLALVYVFVRQRSTIQMGLVSVLLLATTHLTMSSRTLLGYHDSLIYLCGLGALMTRSWSLRGVLLFLALYGDIRAVFFFPFILIWPLDVDDGTLPIREMAKRAAHCALVFAVWFVSARVLLQVLEYDEVLASRVTEAGLFPGPVMDGVVLDFFDPYILHLSVWVAFKAAWLFMFIPIVLIGRTNRLMAVYLTMAFLAIAGPAFVVHDVSRALAFAFPLIMLGMIALWRSNPRTCLVVTGTCLAVNLTSPFYHGMTWGLWLISYPLPVELIRRIF